MKIFKTANYKKIEKKAQQYKSDADIASEFSNMQINNIEVGKSGSSGWIELSFPEGGEHVGGELTRLLIIGLNTIMEKSLLIIGTLQKFLAN